MANTLNTDQLWQFSLQLYPSIKPICLQWQDNMGANVNLLLLLCYLEQQRLSLSAEQLRSLSAQLDSFSTQFTLPLRALRHSSASAPVPAAQQAKLKQALLQAELELEQIEQHILVQHCPALNAAAAPLLETYLTLLNSDSRLYQAPLAELRRVLAQLS
jgi:uncharacterized protein (TIGR02444 family)